MRNMNVELGTLETLLKGIKAIGVTEGDVLLVHSSLSALGWVCGGAPTVVMALLEAVGKSGTIAMPSFSLENSDPAIWGDYPPAEPIDKRLLPHPVPKEWHDFIRENIPAYDKNITPCSKGLGIIAECFRTYPKTLRSNHPSASFTANGIYAQQIIENHPLSPDLGMASPLGVLYKLGAKILMLGAKYDKCTSFHLAEYVTGKFPKITHSGAVFENGKRVWKRYENYDSNVSDFVPMGEACEKEGFVKTGKIGAADCKLFDMKVAVDFGAEWIIKKKNEK
jgi:aminoglycoside 3-N-acetyltransferase